jgi:hypothetical protein
VTFAIRISAFVVNVPTPEKPDRGNVIDLMEAMCAQTEKAWAQGGA